MAVGAGVVTARHARASRNRALFPRNGHASGLKPGWRELARQAALGRARGAGSAFFGTIAVVLALLLIAGFALLLFGSLPPFRMFRG